MQQIKPIWDRIFTSLSTICLCEVVVMSFDVAISRQICLFQSKNRTGIEDITYHLKL